MKCVKQSFQNNFNKFPYSFVTQIKNFLDINLDNFIANHIFQDQKNLNDILKSIKNKFHLKKLPYKIICLDISHTNWKNTVWWISTMIWWILTKNQYRQFKIPTNLWWNDYESLKYCLIKYFQNNTADLIIIDWWKWQLNIVNNLPNKILLNTDFISIGKWKARKRYWKISGNNEIFYTFKKEIPVNYDNFEDKLLLKLRDEAHRFANKYRKKLSNKFN